MIDFESAGFPTQIIILVMQLLTRPMLLFTLVGKIKFVFDGVEI